MKNVWFKSSILWILYILVSLYFAVFNWQIFIVKLNINLGFGVVEMPPFIVLFLLGFIIIGILSWIHYITRLRKMIYELEHGMEIGKLRDQLGSGRIKKFLLEEKNVGLLKERLGIRKIEEKQEELVRLYAEMNKAEIRERKE